MDAAARELLDRCRELGRFPSATDTLLGGLHALARELRHRQVREEIRGAAGGEALPTYSMIGWNEWVDNLARADRGEL